MATDTIPARLLKQARQRPNEPAYYVKSGGRWHATEWKTYVDQVKSAGKALMALGIEPGDKVAMLGFNRPEWVIFDLGAMAIGAVGAGIYTTCSAEEVQYIVDHAEARVILLEDEAQWQKVAAQRDNLPRLERVVMMRDAPDIDDSLIMSWDEFEAHGDGVPESDFEKRVEQIDPDALGTLIYTSGTTGPPKGVMLSHSSLAWTAEALSDLIGLSSDDWGLSYLPLSHIAEQMLTVHGPVTRGSAIYFAESIAAVADNIREVEPTVVFGVPRIWEKYHSAVSSKLDAATGFKNTLVSWARRIGARVSERRQPGRPLGAVLSAQHKLANYLVFSKLKKALGLANARWCVSGAAPISGEILDFFASLDIPIMEVYGQSEDCGPTSLNVPGNTKIGSVGPPIPGIEVKIADDDEIMVKGPNVFIGYYKDEAATRDALEDGWLHTGDLGRIDGDGFLHITGRKKDIIITAGGKNIAPKNIEAALKNSPLVSEAVVIGDRRKYLSALITLDEEALSEYIPGSDTRDKPFDEISELRTAVQELVDEVNSHLARVETIKKFTILPKPFTVEGGELTPTLKVKRNIVNKKYTDVIETMYSEQ